MMMKKFTKKFNGGEYVWVTGRGYGVVAKNFYYDAPHYIEGHHSFYRVQWLNSQLDGVSHKAGEYFESTKIRPVMA